VNFNLDFVQHWKWYFLVSGVILIVGLAVLPFFGLNLGVDFRGGTRLDFHVGQPVSQEEMAAFVQEHGLTPSTTQLASEGQYVIMRFEEEIGKERLAALRQALQAKYGEEANIQESTVDPTFAKELARKAMIGVLAASVGIAVYVMLRFEYRFAVSGPHFTAARRVDGHRLFCAVPAGSGFDVHRRRADGGRVLHQRHHRQFLTGFGKT